jgi:phospho-N-acetylmuramoyl-pentapeptide-transferase
MIYLFVEHFYFWLNAHHLGSLRVFFRYTTFQVACSILLSFVICLSFGPAVIAWLRRQKIADNPNFDQADINKMTESKKGTPTMGGLLILSSIVATVLLLADLENFYVDLALVCVIVLGAVGATDDWLKLTAARRQTGSRQGLTSLEKLLFQIGIAAILGYWTYQHGRLVDTTHTLYFPFFKTIFIPLSLAAFIIIFIFFLTGFSNAVNLTDGMDGLAAGCMAICAGTFIVFATIAGDLQLSSSLLLPYVPSASQMAVIAGAITGSCLGFLWFNANPAQVFMGDTGSLALGGLLCYVCIVIRQELMLVIVGGIFVAEALSVIMQVSYFKYTKRKFGQGRRIFLMSPLHHHFQKKGWTETQVVVRFWLVASMLAALAIATIKLR